MVSPKKRKTLRFSLLYHRPLNFRTAAMDGRVSNVDYVIQQEYRAPATPTPARNASAIAKPGLKPNLIVSVLDRARYSHRCVGSAWRRPDGCRRKCFLPHQRCYARRGN
jgi:hypothetical protein